jgi:beta-glucosidase
VIKGMRGEGVPVIGYTWFPLFTMIDWRYRFSDAPLEEFYLELGLYRINREQAEPRWLDTPLVDMFRRFAADPQASVGDLAVLPRSHRPHGMPPLATVESY